MDKATLRPYVFEILKTTPQTHFHAIENELRRQVEAYDRHDVLVLQEVLWELLVQGVLAPGKNSLNLNLPFVHVTEHGARCLEDGGILAYDPDGYVTRLARAVGQPLDGPVAEGVREALVVFLGGSLHAAVILLARVAESLFDRLRQTLLRAATVDDAFKQELHEAGRDVRGSIERMIGTISRLEVPKGTEIEPLLNGLLALVQLARNPDGTPAWPGVTHEQLRGYFLLFPEQCALLYRLIETFEGAS